MAGRSGETLNAEIKMSRRREEWNLLEINSHDEQPGNCRWKDIQVQPPADTHTHFARPPTATRDLIKRAVLSICGLAGQDG